MQPPDGSTSAPPEFLQGFFSEAYEEQWARKKGMNTHVSEYCLAQAGLSGPCDGPFDGAVKLAAENAPLGQNGVTPASGNAISNVLSDAPQHVAAQLDVDRSSLSQVKLSVVHSKEADAEQTSRFTDARGGCGVLVRHHHAPETHSDGESRNDGFTPISCIDTSEHANRLRGTGVDTREGFDSGRKGADEAGELYGGEDSDEQLVLRVQFGDEEALASLRRRYGGLLQSQAIRVLRSREEADDAVSEVFIEVWQRASCYHSERARPVAWLVTLVRRRAIDRLRIQQRQRKIEIGLSEKQIYLMPDGVSPVEEEMNLAEIRSTLESALNKLPAEQGRAVWMAYCKGFSQKEISKITKAPVGTVKTRLEIGLRKMRQRLAQDESILNALRGGRLGKAPSPGRKAGATRATLKGASDGVQV